VDTLTAAVVLFAAVAALLAARLHVLLQMLQQEHYENARLLVWLRRDKRRLEPLLAVALAAAGVAIASLSDGEEVFALFAAVGLTYAAVRRAARTWRRKAVKALVFTARAKRLFAVALGLSLTPPLVALVAGSGSARIAEVGVVGGVVLLMAPLLLGAANRLLAPVQRAENERYVRAARRKLEEVAPLVVGISGSFGKTTTKACVAAALDPNGPAYPTPASFNSHLGVVRAINEGLERRHETFVVELGAYRIGDVAQICELVQPQVGILTNLGPAHLERFGSMDAIERAEGELADALPPDGLFVTRADDERCRRVAHERAGCTVLLFSTASHPDADLWARDIAIGAGGTEFELCWRGGETVRVASRLLGEPNVANLLAAAAVAHRLGVTPAQIARALRRVTPPQHRLQPIVNAQAGIVVIDDSYNSNPVGAVAALDVLRAHEATRRILVTPGMVELGDDEERENRALGEAAAIVCDVCVLSGPLAPHIRAGLVEAGFDEDSIVMTPDGPAAHAAVAEMGRRGDVFLFENDLPDVYA